MPLGRFFRKREEPTPPEERAEDESAPEQSDEDAAGDESLPPEFDEGAHAIEESWRDRAVAVLPGGTSTGSKRPAALYGPGNEEGPTHYVRASGCHLITPSETTLIDCSMALGAVSIGYGDERVVRAAIAAAANGNVSGLAHTSEVEVAERLCEVIPCAERVRFLKSGAEAVAAAVRIARTATGRSKVVGSGYFGWLDWCGTAKGIPAGVRGDFRSVAFDDAEALAEACRDAGDDLAAIVLEPVIERMPSPEWVAMARSLCDASGALLIFDEMKTGFRLARGGYQELAGITPDLAAFGKAMANGFPVAAVVGKEAPMSAVTETWISTTLAGDAMALAAVGAVLDSYEEEDVCGALARIGSQIREAVGNAAAASGVPGVSVEGLDPMWFLRFGDAQAERRFYELAVREGVLFKRGPYNYASLAHGDEDLVVEIERAASSAFVELADEMGA